MPKKKTIEEYKKEVEELGNGEYEVLSNEYFGNKVKLPMQHKICGFKYEARPNDFISGCRCPYCAGKVRKNTEYFKNEVKDLVGDEYTVIGEYIGTHRKIKFLHNRCGNEFEMSPHNFLQGQRCPKCQHRSYAKTTDEFKQEVFDMHDDEYSVIGEYVNNKTKIAMKHNICGNTYEQTPSDVLFGYRCPYCYGNIQWTQEKFEQAVYDKYKFEYSVLGRYINNNTKILMKHNRCGHVWYVRPRDFIYKDSGCPKCSQSKGEKRIERYLKSCSVEYILQHKFDDFRGRRNIPYSFDFYLPDYNLLIEYQGQQHERAVDFFGGEEKFEIQKEIDKKKKEYAQNNHYDFLEIWYRDYDNIENILSNKLAA